MTRFTFVLDGRLSGGLVGACRGLLHRVIDAVQLLGDVLADRRLEDGAEERLVAEEGVQLATSPLDVAAVGVGRDRHLGREKKDHQ